MNEFEDEYWALLEERCRRYEQALVLGEQWAQVPYGISKRWLELHNRDQVTAAEAAELVRECDCWEGHEFGIAFFAMCNSIRKWYRNVYERELSETFHPDDSKA